MSINVRNRVSRTLRLALAPLLAGLTLFSFTPSSGAAPLSCAIFAFEGGSSIINSATSISGDVCYAKGVTSTTNQKAPKDGANDGSADFIGTVRVHSAVAAFSYTDKNFLPSGGILTSGQDGALDSQDAWLKALSSSLGGLAANTAVSDPLALSTGQSFTINAFGGGPTVVDLSQLDLNGATLTLKGGGPYVFNFRNTDPSTATFDWSQSVLALESGASAEQIFWNFLDPFDITINKDTTVFAGTILAPTSSVDYHNPATFTGSINALNINLHSDFNLTGVPAVIPAPAALPLLASGLAALGLIGFGRRRTA